MWKPLPSIYVLETLRTISASGGLGLLQMVSEPDIEQYANEKADLERGWTRGGVPLKTLVPKEGGL